MDEMELALRKGASRKMWIIGILGVLFGGGVLYAGVTGQSVSFSIAGGIAALSGILLCARAVAHMKG